ncbi:hypothetical protein [Sphingomonas sp. OK281]|uniref:hypothetical protein n=1 Tax=Sphingomonas sp. OK281 TaxID=1881067 RepID=UPI001C314D43|nr:hypothetical protein [Sphingomonas sp. OK281]
MTVSVFPTNLSVRKTDKVMKVRPIGSFVETIILRESWEVVPRLDELNLDLNRLLHVRSVALGERANATPFHCANAPGTFAYQYGTWALREQFVDEIWRVDRSEGVEGIYNSQRQTRVVFCNVDVSCNDIAHPKPRSDKGSGAERVCQGNLFGSLPVYTQQAASSIATYYLMVDETGAVELSRPIIADGTFVACLERIYLSQGGPNDELVTALPLDSDDAIGGFDPQVARK